MNLWNRLFCTGHPDTNAAFSSSDEAFIVTALALFGYFANAQIVENLYPFSSFPMYSAERPSSSSRIVVRTGMGTLSEVREFRAITCDGPLEIGPERCPALEPYYAIDYIDREIIGYILAHPAEARTGEDATLVRHVWRFVGNGGPARTEDCELVQCRVVRR